MILARKRLIKSVCSSKSGFRNGWFQGQNKLVKAFLLFMLQREQRQAWDTAAISSLVHHVFQTGDSRFRYDSSRSTHQDGLELASFFMMTLANKFEQRHALFRESGC
jgi:hypothetical protein